MEGTTQQQLEACVRIHLPEAGAGRLYFERVRTGKFNESWLFITEVGSFLVRIAPPDSTPQLACEAGMLRRQPALLAMLRDQTSIPVPRIAAEDFSRRILDRDFVIVEALTGRPLSESPEVDLEFVHWQLGQFMQQAHSLTSIEHGYTGDGARMEPRQTWREAFEAIWAMMLADLEAAGLQIAEESRELRRLLASNGKHFPEQTQAALLHMDLTTHNVLVDREGKVTGLLDWDRALWGDRELDFAVLDYAGFASEAFWQGYGERPENSESAQRRKLFYLAHELHKFAFIRAQRDRSPKRANHYKKQAGDVLRQLLLLP